MVNYVPDRGDIIWLDLNPQAGKEQMGRRPAFVLSPKEYNAKTGLIIACPITSQVKNYPFEVKLHEGMKTKGVILSDHVKSLDWKVRNAEFIESSSNEIIEDVQAKLSLLIL